MRGPFPAVAEEGVGQDEELSHDRDQGELLRLAGGDEPLVGGAEVGVEAGRDQRRHVEGAAQVRPAAADEGVALPAARAAGDWAALYPTEWAETEDEARCLELGKPETDAFLAGRIRQIREQHDDLTVLIGGPPCQAYSLAGRSRNAGKKGYDPVADHRNFLYEQYVEVVCSALPRS